MILGMETRNCMGGGTVPNIQRILCMGPSMVIGPKHNTFWAFFMPSVRLGRRVILLLRMSKLLRGFGQFAVSQFWQNVQFGPN